MATTVFVFDWPQSDQKVLRQALIDTRYALSDLSVSRGGKNSVWDRFASRLRTRHRMTFDTMLDPISNERWTPLTPEYAARKPAGTKNRILYRTGTLRKALTVASSAGNVFIKKPLEMIWGVGGLGVYPAVHQKTVRSRKDGAPLRRAYLGMKLPDDLIELAKLVQTEAIAAFRRLRKAA